MLHAILKDCMNIIRIHKVTFKKFICHIGGVKCSVHIHEENEATATVCTHSGFLTI